MPPLASNPVFATPAGPAGLLVATVSVDGRRFGGVGDGVSVSPGVPRGGRRLLRCRGCKSPDAEPRMGDSSGEVTRLIQRCRDGDDGAQDALFESVYSELRQLAASYMRRERAGHTLPPTGLVHEAFLRMEREDAGIGRAENRSQFFGIAAQAMRRILVEHARFHAAQRRPSARDAEVLDERIIGDDGERSVLEVLAVDEAMDRLKATNARQAMVVELRYFAGLDESEVATVLGLSRSTVSRDWRVARLMLKSFLSGLGHPAAKDPAADRA